jgi:hypothetical protein
MNGVGSEGLSGFVGDKHRCDHRSPMLVAAGAKMIRRVIRNFQTRLNLKSGEGTIPIGPGSAAIVSSEDVAEAHGATN